ncbi:MAG: cation-translocating P-type ATPase, partial [Deltaproteobacteria bacterium]|nr:cation-translocating P-type ATPase [Deltaproteobacteria bacterium]
QVFSILFHHPDGPAKNFRETPLYKACLQSGMIARNERGTASGEEPGKLTEGIEPLGAFDKELAIDLTLKVEGMWCPACSWLIEEVLRQTKGVFDPRGFFLTDLVNLKYLPHLIRPEEILGRISQLGYRPALLQDQDQSSSGENASLLALGISAILTMNIMMVSFALYFGFFQDFSPEVIGYLSYPLWAMATPVVFYGGRQILKKAFIGLRYGSTSMETLVTIGALAAYFYSLVQMARGSLHLYFDTASMLITLTLLGKYIEARARRKVSKEINQLYRLAHPKVRLIREGKEKWVLGEGVQLGDDFLVLPGEKVPLDSQVISGGGIIDESLLTGEPRPIKKRPGDRVMGGVMLLQGELKLRATRLGEESTIGQLVTLMQKALREKNPFEMLADRVTHWFVPSILALAAMPGFFLLLAHSPAEEVFLRSITVLVISCPCALGIAVPLVKVAAVGLGLSKGIVIRDPGALERVRSLDTLIFDKTGTLTEGNYSLQEIITEEGTTQEALARVASVEIHSNHFLAREMIRKARESSLVLEAADRFEELEGMGVKGFVGGREII